MMTNLMIQIKDDSKTNDVIRFLKDIDFLKVIVQDDIKSELLNKNKAIILGAYKGRIKMSDDFDNQLPDSFWAVK